MSSGTSIGGVAAHECRDDLRADSGSLQGGGCHHIDGVEPGRGRSRLLMAELRQRGISLALPAPQSVPFRLPMAEQQ